MSSSKINLGKVALTPKGEWSATATYERLDVVSYQGSSYTVLKTCTGQTPAEGEYYTLLAEKGDDGEQGTELGWLDASSLLVGSFNHRSGHVVPMAGDYTPEMVGASDKNHNHDSVYYKKDQVDSLLQMKSNENLLDNWYFRKPINILGDIEYLSPGYTIDRWAVHVGVSCKITTDGIQLTCINTTGRQFYQIIDRDLRGMTVTFSIYVVNTTGKCAMAVMTKDNRSLSRIEFDSPGIHSVTAKIPNDLDAVVVGFSPYDIDVVTTVAAAKLETGNYQTLGYMDDDSYYLLDPEPNPAIELEKCHRYQTRISCNTGIALLISTNTILFFIPLPTMMRANPKIVYKERLRVKDSKGIMHDGFTYEVSTYKRGGVTIYATKNNHGLSDVVLSLEDEGSFAILDANL